MSAEEEDDGGGIPEWVVTFGDMMSLLLTFFIMLVSLSEIKEEEKYQALVESIQQQFGYSTAQASFAPGSSKPRNSHFKQLATQGRAKRKDTMRGGDKVEAPVGENRRVEIVRPGTTTAVGTVIFFQQGSGDLSDAAKISLREQTKIFKGKPQKIQIRGHSSRNPVEAGPTEQDFLTIAFHRCQSTRQYLVDQLGIQSERVLMTIAGPHEPTYIGTEPDRMKENARVEVYLLDEVVDQRIGTEEARNSQFKELSVSRRQADADETESNLIEKSDLKP